MFKPFSRTSMSILFLAALIGTAATLPTSSRCPELVLSGIRKRATNEENLASPNTTITVSLPSIITADSHYHISDTPIDLRFTCFGRPITSGLVFKTVEAAIDKISTSLSLHPTESITHGFFRQRYNDLEINIREYSGKQITWSTLNQLLLGIQYFTRNYRNSRVLEFEIDISGMGRAGYGSLRYTDLHRLDLTERAVVDEAPQISNVNISSSIESNSSSHLVLPSFTEENIVFSFYFFGQPIPTSAMTTSYRLARQTISTNVRLHPNNDVPNESFKYQPDHTRVEMTVVADMDKQLTWLLLDNILEKLAARRWGPRLCRELMFEFEIYPFKESYGHGSVRYHR